VSSGQLPAQASRSPAASLVLAASDSDLTCRGSAPQGGSDAGLLDQQQLQQQLQQQQEEERRQRQRAAEPPAPAKPGPPGPHSAFANAPTNGDLRAGSDELRLSTFSAPLPTLASPFGGASPFAGGGGLPWQAAGAPVSPRGGGSPAPPPVAATVTSYGSGPVMAPRKPRAQRQVDALQQAESRERRKSERRLSKGAQIAWSTCQIIESRELKLQSAIGSGAYGRVWLAEWMGTQVAAKELLCLTDRVKDDVSRKRRKRRGGEEGDGAGDGASDSGSDR
jgi:hypothetical protein